MDDAHIFKTKRDLRRRMFGIRADMSDDARAEASNAISSAILAALIDTKPGIVAGFWPLTNEVDVRPALEALASRGWTTALPRMQGGGRPLNFRQHRQDEALIEGAFGVMEPSRDNPIVIPNVLIVPLLAFDSDGYRLGYGGGFYDRSLDVLEKTAHGDLLTIGVAFSALQVDSVPIGPFDKPLHMAITEDKTHHFRELNF